VYRLLHPEIFIAGQRSLDATLGGINTVILICSSLTMAWAVRAAQHGHRRVLLLTLSLTLLFGAGFLGIKGVEYEHKWKHGLLWGTRFRPQGEEGVGAEEEQTHPGPPPIPEGEPPPGRTIIPPAAPGPQGMAAEVVPERARAQVLPRYIHIFFGIYFLMTGLHGVHAVIGLSLIAWLLFRARRGDFSPQYFTPVDLVGLYWHLVDIVWIFLFPLLYLIH